ncbi:menaquinone-dependent protoporphyrinogen IX dehydrogenase [Vibrio sp. TH_r3]|uniref:menaquinone-dependent protoporphyrinogen IX dehydrogenase n=1 Tax=Vibrio sp. TH_r3 TaxID=3082084 RepID=UPI00295302EC|nr:menaquinone-dependent protoporphyrinogen IX dehydrogenase [Vibrio sp. TH_r3]MDV7106332.1 menaquinone-dependent protoporphyrinogen IX dehydrogenase [Vibrio sp. TH_r3]
MKKILFLYATTDGQTVKICKHIQSELPEYHCELQDLNNSAAVDFSSYEKIVVGASIRYGHLSKNLYHFIDANIEELNRNKVAFFCVNLTARKEEQGKDTPEGSVYMRTFLKKSPWTPKLQGVFAGALRYPKYKFFDRIMIQLIMKVTGGETDTTKEIEYTNWNKVSDFASRINNM